MSPRNIQQWLPAGASPRTLVLEIGALLLHPEADAGSLDDMRSLLHLHKELLEDTAKWPVPHVVKQLASQDLGASVQHDETDGSGAVMCRLIECIKSSSTNESLPVVYSDHRIFRPSDQRGLLPGHAQTRSWRME